MATDDDRTVIVCSPAALGPAAVPEAIMLPCVDCSQPSWVSPSSFEILAEGADVLCMPCLEKRVEANPGEPLEIRPNPKFEAARAREVEAWRRRRDVRD